MSNGILITNESEQGRESGDEYRVWSVFEADEDGEPVGTIYTGRSREGAHDLALNLSRERGLTVEVYHDRKDRTMTRATATITLQETRLMLERGKLFAATYGDRPTLRSMHLAIVDGHVRAEASDGFALMIHAVDTTEATGKADMLLALDDIKAALKALPNATKAAGKTPVTITIVDNHITIDNLRYGALGGTFPNLDRLIPRETAEMPTEQIGIAGPLLERVGRLSRGPGSGAVRMHIPENAKRPMVFTVRDSDNSRAVAVVMPMFIDKLTLSALVNEVLV